MPDAVRHRHATLQTAYRRRRLGVGPILLGFVAAPFGIPWAFALAAAIALVGALWTVGLMRRAPAPA